MSSQWGSDNIIPSSFAIFAAILVSQVLRSIKKLFKFSRYLGNWVFDWNSIHYEKISELFEDVFSK